MIKKEIPVLLLTGYLGSGKTTLLNRLLRERSNVRFAVIVNDIGEVNIDADLINRQGVVSLKQDNLIPLQNGCICCTLKTDLLQQLQELCVINKADANTLFDYIIIEASGICEPLPIAQTIASYPNVVPLDESAIPILDCIVTVVDALRTVNEFDCGDRLTSYKSLGDKAPEEDLASLVIQQIECCNIILLNKIDKVNSGQVEHLKAIIRSLQNTVQIIPCTRCDVPVGELLNTHRFSIMDLVSSPTWMSYIESDGMEEDHHEEGEALEYGIHTFVYYRRQPFDMNRFDHFVATQWPQGVIRCKGLCYFQEEYDNCYIFEQSGHQVELKSCGAFYATMPPQELQEMLDKDESLLRDWDDTYGDRMQKLVFIGQHIDEKEITRQLDNCLTE